MQIAHFSVGSLALNIVIVGRRTLFICVLVFSIVEWVCPSCTHDVHTYIYYKTPDIYHVYDCPRLSVAIVQISSDDAHVRVFRWWHSQIIVDISETCVHFPTSCLFVFNNSFQMQTSLTQTSRFRSCAESRQRWRARLMWPPAAFCIRWNGSKAGSEWLLCRAMGPCRTSSRTWAESMLRIDATALRSSQFVCCIILFQNDDRSQGRR